MGMHAGHVGVRTGPHGSLFHAYFCSRLRGRVDADAGRLPQVSANDEPFIILNCDHDDQFNDSGDDRRDHGYDDDACEQLDFNDHDGFVVGCEASFFDCSSVNLIGAAVSLSWRRTHSRLRALPKIPSSA